MVFTKISMLSEIISGQSPQSCFYNLEKIGLPFYQGKKEFSEKYIDTPSVWTTQKTKVARKGDILMSVRAPVGPVNFATEKCCIGRGLAIIRPNEKIDKEYLFYFFINYQKYISGHGGAVFDSINKDEIGNIEIPLPAMEEQKKIAARLDAVSDLLAKQKQLLSEQDTLIQSLFYDIFGDPIKNNKGWKIEKLGKVCDVRDGTHDSPSFIEKGYPLVTSKNLSEGMVSFKNVSYISKEDYDKINIRSKVDAGDLLMPMIGTIGNPVIVLGDASFAIKNVALIKFNKKDVLNIYIKYILSSEYFKKISSEEKRGGTQKFMSLGSIRGMKIPVPPLELQEKFAAIVEQIESEKSKIKSAIAETQTLFNSMMSEYFEE